MQFVFFSRSQAPPPPPLTGNIPSQRLKSEIGDRRAEPPLCVQNAMMTKDKKPFTYTPGGLNLAEIKSPSMARRIERNANAPGVSDKPKYPNPNHPCGPLPPSALAAMQPAMPTQVFPSGAPPPPPPMANPPPPPPPMQALPTTKVATNDGVFERPDMTRIIPENPMALLKRTPRVERKSFVDQMNDFDSSNVIQSNGATNNQPQQRQESPQYTQDTAQRAPQYSPQYTQQSPQYTQQSPQFTQQSPQYNQQSPQYTQQSPQYTQQSPQFMQQSPQYNQQSPQFNQQSPQYTQQSPQFMQQSPQYNQQSPQYTQQSPQYIQQSPQYNPQPKFPPQAQFNAQPQPYQNNRPQMVQEAKQPSPPPVQQKTSNANLGSLYIPPIAQQQQQQSSPSPQSPPMPKLNAAPKPWQNQKKQEQDVPAWAQRRESPPKVQQQQQHQQQQQQQQQQPPQGARIVVQPRLVQQPLQQPPPPRDGVEVVWVTQPEVYQHPGGPAPPQLYSQKSPPVQQQVRTPPVQQQQQVRTSPVQQQQQQGRIIPIQIEGGNQNNQPQTPNNDRNLNRQQSWTPTQSNSFKALQKMTRTDGDDVGDGVEHGPRTAQQYPAEQMRKMQLNDGDKEFMNRVKQERYYKLAEENPRYRGGHIPSRVFRILDQSGGESLRNEEDPRYMGPAIPSKAFRLLQAMTQENPQENNNDVPQGSDQGPKVRRIPVQVENYEAPQPYVHPSEQTVPEPKKYTGSAIPSRAFRMVQAMTDLADDESCSENYERPQQWGSCYDYPPYYPYPPPPPPPQYYPQENPYYHSQSDSESERQVCTSCRKTPVPFWGYYPPYYQNGYETGTDSECEESQPSKQYYNYWDPYYYSYWYPQMYYPYPSDYEGYSSCDEYYSKTPTITVTPSEENSKVEIVEQEMEDDIRDDVSEATVVESEYCESVQEQTDYDEENEGDVETYSTDDACSVYAEEENVIPHVLSVIFEETERFSRESSVATELSEETLVDYDEEHEEVVSVKLPLKLSYSEDTKEITQVEVDDFTAEYTLRSPSRTPKERSPCKFEDEEEKDDDISTTITLKFSPKEEETIIVKQEENEEEEIDFWSQINNDDDAPRNAYRTSNYSAESTDDAQIIRVEEEMGESQHFSNENCSEVIENKETNVVQSVITKESEADEVVNTKVTKVVTSYQCEDDEELIVGAGVLTSTQERKITSAKVGDIESTLDVISKTHEDRKYAVGIKASEDQIEKCHVEDFKISNLVFEKEQLKQTLKPPAFSLGLDECFKSIANNLKLALGEFQPVEYVEEATETKTTSKRFTTAKCTENKETSEKVVKANKACDNVDVEEEKINIAEESNVDENMNVAEEFEVDEEIVNENSNVPNNEVIIIEEHVNEEIEEDDEEEVNTSEDEESSSTDSSDSSPSSSRRSSSVEEKPPEQDMNNNQDFYVPTIKERIRALQNASRNSDKIKKEKPNILTTPRRSLEADNSEDDSGVTSDMSRHISDTECEFTELKKMSKYQRAATHSRLFKLLQEECEDEDEEDEKDCRREKLSLPLSDYESFSSSGVTSPSTPSDKLVNELVQSLLKKKKGRLFRGIPIEKLQAAAYKILSEDKDLSSEEVSNYLSQNATAVQTPQEFYNEYSEYYKSFGDPNPQKPKHHAEKRTTAAS